MRLSRCPICHSRISLEALVQDEAGRELLALVAKLDTQTGVALVSYLGLLRSPSRDLANERALRLAGQRWPWSAQAGRIPRAKLSPCPRRLRRSEGNSPANP